MDFKEPYAQELVQPQSQVLRQVLTFLLDREGGLRFFLEHWVFQKCLSGTF